MTMTSEAALHDVLVPVWKGFAAVGRQVTDRVLFDEVLPQLDLSDPPEPLAPAARVLQLIEDEMQPGGRREWPGGELDPLRRRHLALAALMGLISDEISRLKIRIQAHQVIKPVLSSRVPLVPVPPPRRLQRAHVRCGPTVGPRG